jgi:hypothetical protein
MQLPTNNNPPEEKEVVWIEKVSLRAKTGERQAIGRSMQAVAHGLTFSLQEAAWY